jgi:hypothetical protein
MPGTIVPASSEAGSQGKLAKMAQSLQEVWTLVSGACNYRKTYYSCRDLPAVSVSTMDCERRLLRVLSGIAGERKTSSILYEHYVANA